MLYLFDREDILVGELMSGDLIECIQEEVLNGTIGINFTITLESLYKMEGVESVIHKDINDSKNFYMYKLVKNEPVSSGIAYEGVFCAFDDLKSYGYLQEKVQTMNLKDTLEVILTGSRWHVGEVDSYLSKALKSTNFYYTTRLEAISKLIELWDVEVSYRIDLRRNLIYGRYIDLYLKRGKDTGKRFVYGDNALEVVKETSVVDLYTAAIGRGKDIQTDVQDPNGNSRKVNFSNLSWHIANGDIVTKPLGQEWLELPERTKLYGYSDGKARFKVLEFTDIESPIELLRATYKELEANSRPQVQFKLSSNSSEGLEIGDTVVIIRKDLDIHYASRVFKIKRDLINGVTSELEFGDNIDYSQSKRNKDLQRRLEYTNEKVVNLTNNAVKTAEKFIENRILEVKIDQDEIKENIEVVDNSLNNSKEEIKNLQSGNVVLFRSMADNITQVESFKDDLEVSKEDISILKDENIVINNEIKNIKISLEDDEKEVPI